MHLTEALEKVSRQGSFAFKTVFRGAPVQGLDIDSIARLVFPLNARDAYIIKDLAAKPCLRPDNQRDSDISQPGVWAVDLSKISFPRSAWKEFENKIIENVCKGLGLPMSPGPYGVVLRDMLLYETGS